MMPQPNKETGGSGGPSGQQSAEADATEGVETVGTVKPDVLAEFPARCLLNVGYEQHRAVGAAVGAAVAATVKTS